MNMLPVDRALNIYGALADRAERKGVRERLSKHLMQRYIEGERDQHRLRPGGQEPAPREHGESRYTLRSLFELSLHAILGFSNLPLRLGVLVAALVAGLGTAVGAYSLVMRWLGDPPSGYTTIVVLLCFLFAVQFVLTGVIGEYVGHVFAEVKQRPLYLVDEALPKAGGPDAP